MATANFTAEDWITEPQNMGRKFEFARADGNQPDLLLPITKIQSWAPGKVAARQAKRGHDHNDFYQPIIDKDEFRVMELKPGVGDEDLRGALHHCSVEFVRTQEDLFLHTPYTPDDERYTQRFALSTDDYIKPVLYTALSYTWGKPDPSTDTTIDCEGHKLKITKSLATALKHFRQKDHSILLWVDQICINQLDSQEKIQQIPLMSSIYRYATNTSIWLGEADSGSTLAMQLLDDLGTRLQFSEAIDINPREFERMQLPQPESRQWQDLMNLLGRQWFSRLWIIQEVILSRAPWVLCGDYHVHWSVIENGCHQLTTSGMSNWLQRNLTVGGSHADTSQGRRDHFGSIMDLSHAKFRYDSLARGPRLLSLLVSTRNAECYDARDKVYGLLGICADDDVKSVEISYADNWPVAKLYHDMTVKLLRSGESLSSFIYSVDHESPDLPSWVPDWRVARQTTALGYSSFMLNVYQASGELPRNREPDYNYTILDENNTELRVRGTFVNKLGQIGDHLSDPDISYVNPSTTNKTLLSAYKFVHSNLEHCSDSVREEMFSTFWRTLVASQDADGMRHCPDSFAEIFSLLLDESTNQSPSLPGQTYSKRQTLPKGRGKLELQSLESRKAGQTFQEIRKVFRRVLRNRRLGILGNGLLGLFPRHCRSGDMVYVIYGCITPVLLRPVENEKGKFQLVGECYVHGIMRGESLNPTQDTMEEIILK
ncbi:hypothetical protein PFICI_03287 [Pestalotiopsis fici W106-1]|uniref:Heterokaryon incompatibility domain-containing protein n=1 Tax=Pestalotiopsis fici (strain W106-1 / CGMCC3.15140) TaxID=1229662 RepID=W3XIL4_PESFW|nr:uncharacterized protein PFICI_03287 [Pestalotiopsis fici W106-1]ETS85262.1 hypothetical protein PFICI_03287 [Pestalotiopsis fici W106-1]